MYELEILLDNYYYESCSKAQLRVYVETQDRNCPLSKIIISHRKVGQLNLGRLPIDGLVDVIDDPYQSSTNSPTHIILVTVAAKHIYGSVNLAVYIYVYLLKYLIY